MKIISEDNSEVLVCANIKVRTEHAVMIENADSDDVWLPLKFVEIVQCVDGDQYELLMPLWLAEQKEII